MQYTHAYRHTYMQTYKHLCLYMQYLLACMHACMQTHKYLCLYMHYTFACMQTLFTYLGKTHMQCHAHNKFFSVNMCYIYFLSLIYLTVQFKCILIQSFWCYFMCFIKCNISCYLATNVKWSLNWIELNWIELNHNIYLYRHIQKVISLVSIYQRYIKTVHQHSRFWTEYFGETLLRPQRIVAEFWLTNPLPELAVGGVLVVLGGYRSES